MTLSIQEEHELAEKLIYGTMGTTVIEFCSQHGYDLSDEELLGSILETVYDLGFDDGQQNMMEAIDEGAGW